MLLRDGAVDRCPQKVPRTYEKRRRKRSTPLGALRPATAATCCVVFEQRGTLSEPLQFSANCRRLIMRAMHKLKLKLVSLAAVCSDRCSPGCERRQLSTRTRARLGTARTARGMQGRPLARCTVEFEKARIVGD